MTYGIGSTIEYLAFGGIERRVRVTQREADIKGGRAGFEGEIVSGPDAGQLVWGYDSQIDRVID